MRKLFNTVFNRFWFRIAFLIVLIVVVFGYSKSPFYSSVSVNAFSNQVIIFPEKFSENQNNGELKWKNTENVFFQDLPSDARFYRFNTINSAYIVSSNVTPNGFDIDDAPETPLFYTASTSEELDLEVITEEASTTEEDDFGIQEFEDLEMYDDEIGNWDEEDSASTSIDEILEEIMDEDADSEADFEEDVLVEGLDSEEEFFEEEESVDIEEEVENEEKIFELDGDTEPVIEFYPEPSEINIEIETFIEEVSDIFENNFIDDDVDYIQEPTIDVIDLDEASETEEGIEEGVDDIFSFNKVYKSLKAFFDSNNIGVKSAKAQTNEATSSEIENLSTPEVSEDLLQQDLIFSNFSLPLTQNESNLSQLKLKFSLAGRSLYSDDKVVAYYKLGENWEKLGELSLKSQISNFNNNNYFEFTLPDTVSWSDIEKLQVKISYENPDKLTNGSDVEIYLDAIWLEASYNDQVENLCDEENPEDCEEDDDEESEEEVEEIDEKNYKEDFDFWLISDEVDFKVEENPKFRFKLEKKRGLFGKMGDSVLDIFRDEYSGMNIKVGFPDFSEEEESNLNFEINYLEDGEFEISIDKKSLPREFKPGSHELKIEISDEDLTAGETIVYTQDFTWGVLAINTNKATYVEGENVYLQFGVLNDAGHTVCNARLELEITAPDGGIAILSTDNDLITNNPLCGPDNVIDTPDYFANYEAGAIGEYNLKVTAYTDNGARIMTDKFYVNKTVDFEIERIGPTRIYPLASYPITFRITPKIDFKGRFYDYVPLSFDLEGDGMNVKRLSDAKELSWQVDWKAGETYEITYKFNPPNNSPEFYFLGPAKVYTDEFWFDEEIKFEFEEEFEAFSAGTYSYEEARKWQIASDAPIGVIIAEGLSYQSDNSATWTELVTADSSNFTGGAKYFIYVNAHFGVNLTNSTMEYEIRYDSTVVYSGWLEPSNSNYDATPVTWIDVYDQTPTPTEISVYFRRDSGLAYGINGQILAIPLDDLDTDDWKYTENTNNFQHADGNAGGATPDDAVSLTLDSADGTKDWAIFAQEDVIIDSAGTNYEGWLWDGSTEYMKHSAEGEDTNEQISYVILRAFDDVPLNTTYTFQVWDDTVSANNHNGSKMFALNLDAFESHKTYYSGTDVPLSNWTEVANLDSGGNYQPATEGDQIIFGCFIDDIANYTADTDTRILVNASTDPTGWSLSQPSAAYRGYHDSTDAAYNNVMTVTNIPTTGYSISYETYEASDGSGLNQVAIESAMFVFSENMPVTPLEISADAQKESDYTNVVNQGWSTDNDMIFDASVILQNTSEMDFYFQLATTSGTFISSTTEPTSFCTSTIAYDSCPSKVWVSSTSTSDSWYDTDWEYRKKVTIYASQVTADQTDFPVLVTVTDADLAYTSYGGNVGMADGSDIYVLDDNNNLLTFERSYYDQTTGEVVLWVKTDVQASIDTEIYLYYGNSGSPTDLSDPTSVWDGDFQGVYHLDGDVSDSSQNSNNGTNQGSTDTSGVVGNARSFAAASSQYFSVGTDLSQWLGNSSSSLSFWLRTTQSGSDTNWQAPGVTGTEESGGGNDIFWGWLDASGQLRLDSGNTAGAYTSTDINDDVWRYFTLTYDSDTGDTQIYVDGVLDGTGTTETPTSISFYSFGRIEDSGGSPVYFDGELDEIMFSDTIVSEDWIETTYNNQNNPGSFLSFGSEESLSNIFVVASTSITAIPDSYTGYKWQVIAFDAEGSQSVWRTFNSNTPNFMIDSLAPIAPGDLTYSSKTGDSITLSFGTASYDINFDRYRIYYKEGTSDVTENNLEQTDDDLLYMDYNGTTNTTITGLEPEKTYVFRIWAYDEAGNSTPSENETVVTMGTAPRSNTIELIAGYYSGQDGANGQYSNATNTFDSFSFKLAEDGVSVKSAYVIFESQFEAWSTGDDYTGYKLAFDACQDPCTANAFSGSGNILKYDENILLYGEGESNQIRLLLDVTNEVQLSLYQGYGNTLNAQIGYILEKATDENSIANARAKLVITYTYDTESDSYTNTVTYPLESQGSGDQGTRQTVIDYDCTLDSDCPFFDYNMEIPEYSSSQNATTVDYWFTTYNLNDANNANDLYIDVNIEGNDTNSTTTIHESNMAGTQGVLPAFYFDAVSGFLENTAQTLEYHVETLSSTNNGDYYLLGGEVTETYIASTSVSEKTRTVSFPIGIINNGITTASSSASVDIMFPENGNNTGVIDIKKAWIRIISYNHISNDYDIGVSTKVGNNGTSSEKTYNYNVGGTVIKPSFNIVHVIPADDYEELESANQSYSKTVTVYTENSDGTNQGGISAELMITYTYTSELNGYLVSAKHFAGQTEDDGNSQLSTTTISAVPLPERDSVKSLLGAALISSYAYSDSDNGVANNYYIDSNISSTSEATCSNVFAASSDGTNAFIEYYQDVTSEMVVTNNQEYTICFSNDGGSDTTGGAKMNGQLIYTYSVYDPPTIAAIPEDQKKSDNFTSIPNATWTDEDQVYLLSYGTDSSTGTQYLNFYYELIDNSTSFTEDETEPVSSCLTGTSYASCSSKIWTDTASTTDWYDQAWLYRKKVIINSNQIISDETDFPILATTTDISLADTANGGHMASSTGGDLIVVDVETSNLLNYEREYYDPSTGEIVFWIKTDISASENKELYLYYGNALLTTDQSTTTGVWDSDYAGVFHLNDSSGSTVSDSLEENDGLASDIGNWDSGIIDGDYTFDGGGDDDIIDIGGIGGGISITNNANYTIEFWTRGNYVGQSDMRIFSESNTGINNPLFNLGSDNGAGTAQLDIFIRDDGGTTQINHINSTASVFDNTWHHVVWTDSNGSYQIYIDGEPDISGTYTKNTKTLNTTSFGAIRRTAIDYDIAASLDEARFSTIVRDADWIKTQYNNTKDVSSFISFSTEESISSLIYQSEVNVTSIPDSSVGYKWQVIACNDGGECSSWDEFMINPNFFVDSTPPTAPGNLTVSTTTATSITLDFGSQTTEVNFDTYKVFYKKGISGVTLNDTEYVDSDLGFIDYNGTSDFQLTGLEASSQYVINIWAFDEAGNYTGATEVIVNTSDVPHQKANTVMFPAGFYSADGTTGQDSNTNNTFAVFDFSLSEQDVDIKDAFIIFEAQTTAYTEPDSIDGYTLAFDTCSGSACADAFYGTEVIGKSDATVLQYSENDSKQIRILMNVTDEVQLSEYSGGGSVMEAQLGYNLTSPSTINFIASAKAMLYLTYSYNGEDSENYTNTVIYPLESEGTGDSGSRQVITEAGCTENTDCPTFTYNVQIPEEGTQLAQWYHLSWINDSHNANDLTASVNIQSYEVDSNLFVHESSFGGTQGNIPMVMFDEVYGYTANTNQTVEAVITGTAGDYYVLGGEVFETYSASASVNTKTRTVSYPLGVISNGQYAFTSSSSVLVYFPENGDGTGIVNVEKAWFRIIDNQINSGADTVNVATKVGDNSQTSNWGYAVNVGGTVVKSSFNITHIIPSTDYSELELANGSTPKEVVLYVANNATDLGGISAELMITYTYTSEDNGYLSSLSVFGNQSETNADSVLATATDITLVIPELRGDRTIRSGGLISAFMTSDSDEAITSSWTQVGADISSGDPTCSNDFYFQNDAINAYSEFYQEISANLDSDQDTVYTICTSNTNSSDTSMGAKMNSYISYTYQWDAPPPEYTQNDWRWYENEDSVQPIIPLADAQTAITEIDIGEILRLRMNIGVSNENLATSSVSFKLQFVQADDCTTAIEWADVGGTGDTEAWIGYNNPEPIDGETLTANLLASSTVYQSYEEENSTIANLRAVSVGEFGEWDWIIYDYNATATANYCFRMVTSDGIELDDYLTNSYPQLTTNVANTPPSQASSLEQYLSDETTLIPNNTWINDTEVRLVAQATDPNINETITLYFELASSTGTLTTATSAPIGACTSGTAYNSCSSKIWYVSSDPLGDYKTVAYVGTTSITNIPDDIGYKWQVLACDKDNECYDWTQPDTAPNFKIDTLEPTNPGPLTFSTSTPTTITLNFGATTTEINFDRYRIFYREGTFDVDENDYAHTDSNLNYIDYNGATSTTIINLAANTEYVFNIWAYDEAGNASSSLIEVVGTTTSSYTPPTGFIGSVSQKTDGSGAIDIAIVADDPDNDNTLRAKVEYESGSDCTFGSPSDPTLDETDVNISATYGDPDIDNDSEYQVGTTTNWIMTSPGENYVFFDWLSKEDIADQNQVFCIRLTVNDGLYDQNPPLDTYIITIDNLDPQTPGDLTEYSKGYDNVVLDLGAVSSDNNFDRYRIYYKVGTSTVTELDIEHTDANLLTVNYNGATSTQITGLESNTYYAFNIWAYDNYGNRASATQINIKTNARPTNISADEQYLSDAVTTIPNNSWINESDVILSASVHDQDASDSLTFYYQLIANGSAYSTLTSPPTNICTTTDQYNDCSSKIWATTTSNSVLPSDWYDGDWLYRKQITVNSSQVEIDAVDYPLLVNITDTDLANDARTDGFDIIFTTSDGTTTLDFERELFDDSTGDLVAWVKTDIASTVDTVIYMYYGNSAKEVDSSQDNIWDSNFVGVWHMDDSVVDESNQIAVHNDSSSYGNEGNQNGNNELSGIIGYGQEFDGDDQITVPHSGNFAINDDLTVSAWINVSSDVDWLYQRSITLSDSTPEDNYQVGVYLDDTIFDYSKTLSGGDDLRFYSTTGVSYDYFIEEWDTNGTSTIWVEVANSGTDEFYMYYGNSGASAVSSAVNTLEYYDGFDTDTSANYTITDHVDRGTGVGFVWDTVGSELESDTTNDCLTVHDSISLSTLFVWSTGMYTGDDDSVGVLIKDGTNFYEANINGPSGHPASDGIYSRITGNEPTQQQVSSNDVNAQNISHKVGLGYDGTQFVMYVDDEHVASWSNTITPDGIGLVSEANSPVAHYADLLVRKYSSNDPVSSIGAEISAGITKSGSFSILPTISDITSNVNTSSTTASFSTGWNHVVLTFDNDAGSQEHKLYVDGVLVDSATDTNDLSITSESLYIGALFDGLLDEIRISNVVRDSDWITTEYNNQNSPGTFITVGTESRVSSFFTSQLIITIPDSPATNQGYKWQVMACDNDQDCSLWDQFNTTVPNIRIDTTDPTVPGALTENSVTSNTITLNYGAQTSELNFSEYRIFYSTSIPVDIYDDEHNPPDLDYIDYNGESNTTFYGLLPDTGYYFNIWAYDLAGNFASSTILTATTSVVQSSPGVTFYTDGTRVLYYRVWDGTNWGAEQTGPTLGSGVGDNIIQVRALSADDRGKVLVLAKTYDNTNQEWWVTVYRFVADDFVDTQQIGDSYNSANDVELLGGCMASLSGKEFLVVKRHYDPVLTDDGTEVYSWNSVDGWTDEGFGPDPVAVLASCKLVRRPGTDNYLLITQDEDIDMGTAYYYGGSTYSNSWTTWTQHSAVNENANLLVSDAFFDESDNTRGTFTYQSGGADLYATTRYFICSDNSINYGGTYTSPTSGTENWTDDFAQGEFSVNPNNLDSAYFIGGDIDNEANIYKVDITAPTVTWSTTTNGDNISASGMYGYGNWSHNPFAITFYKDDYAVAAWNSNSTVQPQYRVIDALLNEADVSDSVVPGSDSNVWTRVRFYKDPSENEFLALYQNDDIDYAAVFWDGANNRFYNTTNNPGMDQVWTELKTTAGVSDSDYEAISFAFASYNQAPNSPTDLEQYKTDGVTIIANSGWNSSSTILLKSEVIDPDTEESISVYLNIVANIDDLNSSSTEPTNTCASTTAFSDCTSKIWLVATSSLSDYSVYPFIATATITGIPDSAAGYKWQVKACDDDSSCSVWSLYNVTQPNFRVDTIPPTVPGNLLVSDKDSETITLQFGATTTEDNFDTYKIFYKEGSSGVTELDIEHTDTDLENILYNGTTDTIVSGLSSSTEYVFNIWAYDLAGNSASATIEVATTTNARANLVQASYLFENDDGSDVNSNTDATSTPDAEITNLYKGERFALRIQIENSGGDVAADKVYRLEYENQTDYPGVWGTVGPSTEISYSFGLSGISGDEIDSNKGSANTNTWINGAWYENIAQTGTYTIQDSEYTEFVFMMKTNYASLGKTYRFRLYNQSDNLLLDSYTVYPTLTTASSESIKYSKENYASLPSSKYDLSYYFDPIGYTNVETDDAVRDYIISTSQYPINTFAVKHTNNTDALNVTWNGQSSVAASVNNIVLQAYTYGSPNQWTTITTNNTAGANTDFDITALINSSISEYYDGSYWSYFRVYQASGDQIFRTDYFDVSYSAAVADVNQIHYRWRNDDGSQSAATWRESQDVGDPVGLTDPLEQDETIRLRFSVANIGGGSSLNYVYKLEYATSAGSCTTGIGEWTDVLNTEDNHWRATSSANFTNGDATTNQFVNSEGYTFVSGTMVQNPSATSSQISLTEGRFTEIEYAIAPTYNSATSGTYCFRLTNDGTELDGYDVYPIITLAGNENNAPEFDLNGLPSDNGSASTSPTDYNTDVTFTGTGNDVDGDQYYMAICKTDAILAGNNAPPTCLGGEWCISDVATSTEEAECTYTATDPGESLDWYAFVCDKKTGFGLAKCSVSSQGSGDIVNDSPFVINHPPRFSDVYTVVQSQDPGSIFTIKTDSEETDTLNGQDSIYYYVCSVNSASFSGCSIATSTICSVTNTTDVDVECDYTDVAPTADGTYTYYAFMYDNHGLAATSTPLSDSYIINNVEPVLGELVLNGDSPITLNLKGAPDTTVSTVNSSVSDQNGCTDLVSAVAKIYMSAATNGNNCTTNANDCYQVLISGCVLNDCDDEDDPLASYTCTTNMKYYAIPTDNSDGNPYDGEEWLSYIQIYDGQSYISTTSDGVELNTNTGLNVLENLIDFGSDMYLGENTGNNNSTTTIENIGNSPIDAGLFGTDMSGNPSGTINVNNIEWEVSNFSWASGNDLSGTSQTASIIAPKPSNAFGESDEVYWGIGIPFGADVSLYNGLNTFEVVLDGDDW